MAVKKPENLSFEQAMEELATIVNEMEQGDMPLDHALKQFERGVSLANASASKLKHAEQKVAILMSNEPSAEPTPFLEAE
ncbi:Exodeoxyribonuclease VII small subunit [Pseudoalteromonas luteoviolacea B = ATCC 29581]|nr:Exodeoxyribonuclease VII small subunit [Pseudoalteromonas luteoviolacea B = ATCC 29581]